MTARVIVCGGRDYTDRVTVARVLGVFSGNYVLVHGSARGADDLAAQVWLEWRGRTEPHPADWEAHGKVAGFIRNEEMAKLGADVCVAFPGGRGTEDMVRRAKNYGIPVVRVDP